MFSMCEEEAVNVEVIHANVKAGVRALALPSVFGFLLGKEKSRSLVLPNVSGSIRRRRGPGFHLCVGYGLLLGSIFVVVVCGTGSG